MTKIYYRLASLVISMAVLLGNYSSVGASGANAPTTLTGNSYYVSTTGNDANPGTVSAPFKTFAKASSVLQAGSTLYIYAGVYNERLKISNSGTSTAGISVKAYNGLVIIDMNNSAASGIELSGSYITVSGLEVTRSADVCVNLTGSNLVVDNLTIHECWSHGIQADNAAHIKIINSRVFHAVMMNSSRNTSSSWGSAIKVRVSDDVLIEGNSIHHNYGEGLGTRGINITMRGNTVYDNFSVNIYTNSENAVIERNFVYCTPNSGFERDGLPALGIALAEEYFDGWGARINNARVLNNIVAYCKSGIRYNGAEAGVVGGGLKNSIIAYNTLYGSTAAALGIVYGSAQTNSLIANNIIWQTDNKLANVENSLGLTFTNNLWKALPPVNVRGIGDRTGAPGFASTPGYAPADYSPGSSSLAGGGAMDLGITNDFFGNPRRLFLDMGAIQFSSVNPTLTPAATTSATPPPTAIPASITPTAALPASPTVPPPTPIPASITPTAAAPALPTTPPSTPISASMTPTSAAPTQTSPVATNTPTSTPILLTPTSISPTPSALAPTNMPATATLAATATILPSPTSSPTIAPQPSSEKIYDDKDGNISYFNNWSNVIKSSAYNGSFMQTSMNGASITFNFTGQSFSILFKGGPRYRKLDVYVDGQLAGVIDQRLSNSQYKQRWDYTSQLSSGQHTLKLVFVTNSTSSITYGSLDAVIIR